MDNFKYYVCYEFKAERDGFQSTYYRDTYPVYDHEITEKDIENLKKDLRNQERESHGSIVLRITLLTRISAL